MNTRLINANTLPSEEMFVVDEYGCEEVVTAVRLKHIQEAPAILSQDAHVGRVGVAVVEHSVSTDPQFCSFSSSTDGFGERTLCCHMRLRNKTGKGGSVQYNLPRCLLFSEWLEKSGIFTLRCTACKKACGEVVKGEEKT